MRGGRYANRRREIEKGQLAHYIAAIVARLQPLQPAQIILFGSQATGEANAGSDIDLIVVLNGEAMPTTYQEKQALYLEVARLLRDIRCVVPVDLVVPTRPMHAWFMELAGAFTREVQQKGIVLYESHHA